MLAKSEGATVSKTQQILLTRQQIADLCHVAIITIRRIEEEGGA